MCGFPGVSAWLGDREEEGSVGLPGREARREGARVSRRQSDEFGSQAGAGAVQKNISPAGCEGLGDGFTLTRVHQNISLLP